MKKLSNYRSFIYVEELFTLITVGDSFDMVAGYMSEDFMEDGPRFQQAFLQDAGFGARVLWEDK